MENYGSIGRLSKTFGYKGEIKINVEDEFIDLLKTEEVFFVRLGGNYAPLFIEKIKFENPPTVKFENVNSKEEAVKYCNREIFLQAEKLKNIAPKASTLNFAWAKDFLIIDTEEKVIGEIKDVKEFPQQEMAIVEYEGNEILIPLHPDLVLGIDEEEKVMMMDVAEGLLDL